MPEQPVAKLALDTRAHGPYVCEKCDAENEDAILMTDASVVCPECKEPLEAFYQFSEALTSASPIAVAGKKKSRQARWAIHWESPDSSNEGTTAYGNMQEALEAASSWVEGQASDDVENYRIRKKADAADDPWETEDQERMDLLQDILKAIKEGRLADAIADWLEYQGDIDPQDKISIGPSGDVTDRDFDFRRAVQAEAR